MNVLSNMIQNQRRRRLIVLLAIAGIVLSLLYIALRKVSHYVRSMPHEYSYATTLVMDVLFEYIDLTGDFPSSESDLIESDCLRIRMVEDQEVYQIERQPGTWHDIPFFQMFTIAYGIDMNDIDNSRENLILKSTNEPVLLIEPPGWVSCNSELYSKIIYDYWLKRQRQQYR
ncbi:MAG: hypothetical protein JW936_05975 [Sedimentisphaerales bacterium]|nr:hypothetical protein [Sedimentisphaerales bacterium]